MADVRRLGENCGSLTLFTNPQGGIQDDLIVTSAPGFLYVVSNAGCRDKDMALMKQRATAMQAEGRDVTIEFIDDKGLVALQGKEIILTANVLMFFF